MNMDFSQAPWQSEQGEARSFGEVNADLIRYGLAFCEWVLPGGHDDGRGEYLCSGIEGGEGSSCSVNLATGRWNDFAVDGDSGGDYISLCAAVHDVGQPEAKALCEAWLRDEAPAEPERAAPVRDAATDADADEAKRERKQRDVDDVWSRGRTVDQDTATARYLWSRGYTGSIPDTIRHVDDLTYHHKERRWGSPGLIAAVQQADGETTGLQRIYLNEDGTKASFLFNGDLLAVKKALGRLQGGAVRLSAPGRSALVGEGIETTLAALEARPDFCAFATISAGGMAAWEPPGYVCEVVILADNDASGTGLKAAKKVAARLVARGIKTKIALPPIPAPELVR